MERDTDSSSSIASQKPCVNLERARLGRLEIREPLPATIDLSGIEVGAWDLDVYPVETYTQVLEKTDDFFSGDVYTQVEASLRNDGHDDLADKVYILMRKPSSVICMA